jgi:hypothetical protein
MSATITCDRFRSNGQHAEGTQLTVHRVDETVYLTIAGKGPQKNFEMTVQQWAELNDEVRK